MDEGLRFSERLLTCVELQVLIARAKQASATDINLGYVAHCYLLLAEAAERLESALDDLERGRQVGDHQQRCH